MAIRMRTRISKLHYRKMRRNAFRPCAAAITQVIANHMGIERNPVAIPAFLK